MGDDSLHLYYLPAAYFSHRIMIALAEKKLEYQQTVVDINKNEQNQPWYLRVNPKGQIPALRIGGRIIPESLRIMEAVDKHPKGQGPRLVPDESTPVGKLVKEWREKIHSFPIRVITFGIILNPENHTDELKVPKFLIGSKEAYAKSVADLIPYFEQLKKDNPDITEAVNVKMEAARNNDMARFGLENVEKILKEVDKTFDEAEAQLQKNKKANPPVLWLCGPDFTAADITLCVFLGRMDFIGILKRFVDPVKRPALKEYWDRAFQRPSVRQTVTKVPTN
ncbi:ganglioside-induced differentiation-associated protein 1 [Aplysia californica]|uniref:Ganglioside-induced differentiation-associated protein 1 n=1 Tax=Aplysia californica TaxID=6500 RepID=A0ABM1A4W3_APLCA|nr:ganglioside-induced differentiation-associated protein 1 [Aplysia californica]